MATNYVQEGRHVTLQGADADIKGGNSGEFTMFNGLYGVALINKRNISQTVVETVIDTAGVYALDVSGVTVGSMIYSTTDGVLSTTAGAGKTLIGQVISLPCNVKLYSGNVAAS